MFPSSDERTPWDEILSPQHDTVENVNLQEVHRSLEFKSLGMDLLKEFEDVFSREFTIFTT